MDIEIVIPSVGGERVAQRLRADADSAVLTAVGVGDGRYAFRAVFDPFLTPGERDGLFVRPMGSDWRLDLAPALVTEAPAVPGRLPRRLQGYVDERSVRHVAGWVRDLDFPSERLLVELVLPAQGGERVVARARADRFSAVLVAVGVGDGGYAFYALLPETLSEAERDALFVRPIGESMRLELAPALRTSFEPISHVALDIVDNCNLRCPFCVYDYRATDRTHFMSDEVFAQALRLIPFVTDGNFWLSCLHEATLHPGLLDFIGRVPAEYRRKLFYTTNLAKRMPPSYFAAIASSGMHHLNVSLESLDPAIYERMRKGARHRIFAENWAMLLRAFGEAETPPRLRYNVMAYRSNLREIPTLVELLLCEKQAWQVEIRHTYDEPHIPTDFRASEFLSSVEWAWLANQLSGFAADRVLVLSPPEGVGYEPELAGTVAAAPDSAAPPHTGGRSIPRPLNISMAWDGALRVYGEEPRAAGEAPAHTNYVSTNIVFLDDPIRFLLAL